MSLVTIGMSHKTASLDVREKLAVDKNESQKILKKLHSMPLVDEAFILSTCNRTELYIEMLKPMTGKRLRGFSLTTAG